MDKLFSKNPNNHFVRGKYFDWERKHDATSKKQRRKLESKLLQNLKNLYTSNNEEFWNLFKQMKSNSANNITEYQILTRMTDYINTLMNCFKRLNKNSLKVLCYLQCEKIWVVLLQN